MLNPTTKFIFGKLCGQRDLYLFFTTMLFSVQAVSNLQKLAWDEVRNSCVDISNSFQELDNNILSKNVHLVSSGNVVDAATSVSRRFCCCHWRDPQREGVR